VENKNDFKSLEAYQQAFADLKVDCDNETSEECFSYAAKLCGTDFIEIKDKEGNGTTSPASWFNRRKNNWKKAFDNHQAARTFVQQNICEMIN